MCGQTLYNVDSLKEHMATHTTGKVTSNPNIPNGAKFECGVCGQTHYNVDSLKEHMATHATGKTGKVTNNPNGAKTCRKNVHE